MGNYVSMRKMLAFLLPPILAAAPASAGDGGVDTAARGRAGEAAPPFNWEKLIQGPTGTKVGLDSLRGRVVVIDFWAMACGPCVTAIPWWNRLNERFSGKPVTFIAVTYDDDPKAVRRFLSKHPMRGWLALDTDRSMFDAYGVNGIPATVVIDRKGTVVGWTALDSLEEEPQTLERILNGESVKLSTEAWPKQVDFLADVFESIGVGPSKPGSALCLIVIRPASGAQGLGDGTQRGRRRNSVTLRQALGSFYPVRGGALQFEFTPPEEKYDIFFRWPKGDMERGNALLRHAIEATFDITVTVEKRLSDVYVMTVDKERLASWEPGQLSLRRDPATGMTAPTQAILDRMKAGEEFFFTLGTVEQLTDGFSYALDLPVVDETPADGYYTFCFPWSKDKSTVVETIALAKKHLGVTLTRTKREIDVHVVRRRTPDAEAKNDVNDN